MGGALLALCAERAVHAQNDINLTGYSLVFSDEFTSASWTPNNPKGSSTWRSQPPASGDIFGYSVRDQNSLSISNGVLIDKLVLVTAVDSSGSRSGGPVGMKDGSSNALVAVATLGPRVSRSNSGILRCALNCRPAASGRGRRFGAEPPTRLQGRRATRRSTS
jgi:hypothetical protein